MGQSQREANGYCEVKMRGDPEVLMLQRSDYEQLVTAVEAGKEFFIGISLFGDEVWMRLAEVTQICDMPPETVTAIKIDAQENNYRQSG